VPERIIHGISKLHDALIAERAGAAAQRLVPRTVTPISVEDDRGRATPLGTCVLIEVDGHPFLVTAGHVVDVAGGRSLQVAGYIERTESVDVPPSRIFRTHRPSSSGADALDLAVVPVGGSNRRRFFPGAMFLSAEAIDPGDEPDYADVESFNQYFVVGYPASRSLVRVSHPAKHIHFTSFQVTAYASPVEAYRVEELNRAAHLLLKYDHRRQSIAGVSTNPPRLQGLSGGGVFRFASPSPACRLVAIATEHRRPTRVLVATKIAHALTLARQVINEGDSKLLD
jgi:hypothetical protein